MTIDKGIFIRNIYYMLTYAFQELKQNNYEEIAGEEFDEIHDLFAEITVEVDDDPRACYFKQAVYGMYGRMALIMLLLEDKDYFFHSNDKKFISDVKCKNPRCIVNQEAYLPKKYYLKDNHKICDYCDNEIE